MFVVALDSRSSFRPNTPVLMGPGSRSWSLSSGGALRRPVGSLGRDDEDSEFAVQPPGEDVDRSAVGVVRRVGDKLIVGGQRELLVERVCIIGLEDSLAPVVELAVSDQNAEPAGCKEVAVIPRQRVDGAADPDHVVGPGPFGALE